MKSRPGRLSIFKGTLSFKPWGISLTTGLPLSLLISKISDWHSGARYVFRTEHKSVEMLSSNMRQTVVEETKRRDARGHLFNCLQ